MRRTGRARLTGVSESRLLPLLGGKGLDGLQVHVLERERSRRTKEVSVRSKGRLKREERKNERNRDGGSSSSFGG